MTLHCFFFFFLSSPPADGRRYGLLSLAFLEKWRLNQFDFLTCEDVSYEVTFWKESIDLEGDVRLKSRGWCGSPGRRERLETLVERP